MSLPKGFDPITFLSTLLKREYRFLSVFYDVKYDILKKTMEKVRKESDENE